MLYCEWTLCSTYFTAPRPISGSYPAIQQRFVGPRYMNFFILYRFIEMVFDLDLIIESMGQSTIPFQATNRSLDRLHVEKLQRYHHVTQIKVNFCLRQFWPIH